MGRKENVKSCIRVACIRILKKDIQVSMTSRIGEKVCFAGKNRVGSDTVLFNTFLDFGSYVGDQSNLSNCKIGKFCSIGNGVKHECGSHPTDWVSTHPAFYSVGHSCGFGFVDEMKYQEVTRADGQFHVVIENDVWIGSRATILDGVTIGNGAIVAAGSVVIKDVPPYSIVGGIPAKVIKYRFEENVIEILQNSRWWEKDFSWLQDHAEYFSNVEKFVEILEREENE